MSKVGQSEYVPGVCNIGSVEAINRRKMAINASLLTIFVWGSFLVLKAPVFTYVLIALPAFVATTAYLQSRYRFCAGFGAEGIYNFSTQIGKTQRVMSPQDRAKDKKKAVSITIQATAISIVISIFAGITSLILK